MDWTTPDSDATLVYSTVPTAPVVTASLIDSADAVFNWPASTDWGGDATSYEVRLFQDGNLVEDYTTSDPEAGLTDQYMCATWSVQVQALGTCGQLSDWSTIDPDSTIGTCPTS